MDEIVKSENMDVTIVVTPSNVKIVESDLESAGVKSNGDIVEPKTVSKNSFRPLVIKDWNSNDKSEVNTVRVKDTTAKDKAVVSENKGKGVDVVKASACWGNPQQKEYKEKGVIDSGGCQFLDKRLISWQCKKQTIIENSTTEAEYVAAANCCGQMRLSIRREDKVEKAATTASSLDAEHDSGSGPRCQDTILGGVDAQTRFETLETDIQEKDKNKATNDKTEHENMKSVKSQSQKVKVNKKSTPTKSKSKPKLYSKKYLMGPPVPI
ncbi:hypothetical protein Tco_1140118 [Tanacetum coccineum]